MMINRRSRGVGDGDGGDAEGRIVVVCHVVGMVILYCGNWRVTTTIIRDVKQ